MNRLIRSNAPLVWRETRSFASKKGDGAKAGSVAAGKGKKTIDSKETKKHSGKIEEGSGAGFTAPPPPPPPPPPRSLVLVLGGNGFVGSNICKEAVSRGFEVASLSRSGKPATKPEEWMDSVNWMQADALEPKSYEEQLGSVQSIVSCIGAFGSQELMYRLNGEATKMAARVAAGKGVERFIFLSAKHYQYIHLFPPLRGYVKGKRDAEEEVQKLFPSSSTIIRPGMIYGNRQVGNSTIPLQLIGKPLDRINSLSPFKELSKLPFLDLAFSRPVAVEMVAKKALSAAIGEETRPILEIEDLV